ncbi:MAG: hydantoinase/oxoprolinase family protein, partial [Pseudomonadota bacterium]
MARLLGIDTGGTYTDAVVYDDAAGAVLGKAKALTTPLDLALGVGRAGAAALADAGVDAGEISLASLSTTLATNALVEGHGDPTALVLIGFREIDLRRAGLADALGDDPVIFAAGGHDSAGGEAAPVDLEAVRQAAGYKVSAFAVASVFGVRNPAHEIAAREALSQATGLPVSCSHELSAKLGGPKRALTTLLNGRLLGMIRRLIDGAADRLTALGVDAPLMVVKGDGALMSSAVARERPIETILSGPAASVVGAGKLTGLDHAVISDIGGTTTDIAVLTDGRPEIDPDGARVGGWSTMVEAVAMRTHGLGGDSHVRIEDSGLNPKLTLGPDRARPVCIFASEGGDVSALAAQLEATRPGDLDGIFLTRGPRPAGADARELSILDAVGESGVAAAELELGRRDLVVLDRMIAAGTLRRVAFTPTDAAHVLGLQADFDGDAARMAAALFMRKRGGDGRAVAASAEALSQRVIDTLKRRSAELVLETAFEQDGLGAGLSTTPLVAAMLEGRGGLAGASLALSAPLVGLGASAATYYPDVGALLRCDAVVPEHAEVANADGAVAGNVEASAEVAVQS